ncbi:MULTISPECIES: flagellar hook assembly protein FlgD [unclassified Escherichia]|uniref:flagellar hook assembly protein FlgD n=1 Tax=Escherichia TaxID=561 RepID=UPI00102A5B66|nr:MULTISPECIES: flagellar hook capping FlgD N-terminal domain-containing protein [unclassified Escherichia]RZN44862.1 flagellar biosynthesis protein FlgD [Escherichia sp. E13S3]TGC00571.1 flagellar biosynthesis protein FlgD [Escherichia sp. E2661]
MSVLPVMTQRSSAAANKASEAATSNSAASATNGSSAEDIMNNFMQLLVAQMQNQDPTNPMDNNQLTTQLAQFNTAAGVQQLNGTVNSVGMLVTSMQQMNAAEWVGRQVLVEGDTTVSTAQGGNNQFALSVNQDASDVTVTLTDDAGNAYTGKLKDVKAGVHEYTLDDLSDFEPSDPRKVSDTNFTVSYSATNPDGSTPDIVSLKKSKVDSVSFTQTGAVLQLGNDETATLANVYLIE